MRQTLPLVAILLAASPLAAETFTLTLPSPPPAGQPRYMGDGPATSTLPPGAKSPAGGTIAFDRYSLLKDNKPWIPVMGEIHFSRYPAAEWREELLKMKAGGITLVSTYVFWIHHEEEKGKFTWDGDKNVREFVRLCGEVGLPCIVRIGPWCHGEVRNGGFPDWVEAMPRKRSNDPAYLAAVKALYDQIGEQLKGQMFKDGGPVVGIQLENEFKGSAAHLATLKQMARQAGMDVPIYTRTAWDNATDIAAFGTVLPLWGGYAEGFWDRAITSMPGNYWEVFRFGVDRAPRAAMGDPNNAAATARGEDLSYPYLTCELGGGMMSSYHRRINVNPMDAYSLTLVKLGSGSNLPGYYMYHGGTNPEGKLTDMLQETQSRGMWNDMPYKNYDFQAPLGAAGQVRESYHLLRELHLFLADYGDTLARMPATFPANAGAITKTNTADLRWSVRSDGKSAFVFVNNFQRGSDLPAKPGVQFSIKLADDTVKVPALTVPENSAFFLPLNLDLGGITLESATAQPLCKVVDGNTTTTYFKRINGIEPAFFLKRGAAVDGGTGNISTIADASGGGVTKVTFIKPSEAPLIRTHTADGKKQAIILLDEREALRLHKFTLAGKEYAALYDGVLAADGNRLHAAGARAMYVLPPLPAATINGAAVATQPSPDADGSRVTLWEPASGSVPAAATVESVKPAGALRTIKKATTAQGVAEMPADADWDNAAVFRVKLPAGLDAQKDRTLLRLSYAGDVARVYLDGKLILDDYYNGLPLDVALWRYPAAAGKELLVKILPLQKGAPIYLAQWPAMPDGQSVAELRSADLVRQQAGTLEVK
jgi:hypothetical protein